MIEINNTSIPTPSSFKVGINDISNAERNAKGTMLMDRVATKRKLDLSWKTIEANDLSRLLNLISSTFFFVKYPDPVTGTLTTKTFYVGDRSIDMFSYTNGKPVWENVSFNFIEK